MPAKLRVALAAVALLATLLGTASFARRHNADGAGRRTALSLALVEARGGSSRATPAQAGKATTTARDYRLGSRATAKTAPATTPPVFGQPTIAGVGGWGYEVDLRLDPSNANRMYMSSPD